MAGGLPSQRGRKVAEGNQLFLSNLTFETSDNFSCKVVAPSVPGLEQSKQVSMVRAGVEVLPKIRNNSLDSFEHRKVENSSLIVVRLWCTKCIAHPNSTGLYNFYNTV